MLVEINHFLCVSFETLNIFLVFAYLFFFFFSLLGFLSNDFVLDSNIGVSILKLFCL